MSHLSLMVIFLSIVLTLADDPSPCSNFPWNDLERIGTDLAKDAFDELCKESEICKAIQDAKKIKDTIDFGKESYDYCRQLKFSETFCIGWAAACILLKNLWGKFPLSDMVLPDVEKFCKGDFVFKCCR